MAKRKIYTVRALGTLYVTTEVEATSEAEALRKAREIPAREWRQPAANAQDLEGHYVSDVGPLPK